MVSQTEQCDTERNVAEPPRHSHAGTFLGGAVMGALTGAALGGGAWALAYCFTAAVAGPAMFLAFAAIGAAAIGVIEGTRAVRKHMAKDEREQAAGRGAQTAAATPSRNHGIAHDQDERALDDLERNRFVSQLERERSQHTHRARYL